MHHGLEKKVGKPGLRRAKTLTLVNFKQNIVWDSLPPLTLADTLLYYIYRHNLYWSLYFCSNLLKVWHSRRECLISWLSSIWQLPHSVFCNGRQNPALYLSCCCCSVTKLCLTLCDPRDCSMPGSSVLHYLLKFAQIHILCQSVMLFYLLPSPSFAFNLSQHQGLFQWVMFHIKWPKYCSFSFSKSF